MAKLADVIGPDGTIYLDYSTLSTFMTCNEKGRLSYVEHWRPKVAEQPLAFGSAMHAGIAGWFRARSREIAIHEFLEDVRRRSGGALPLGDDKRSVDKGLLLLDAYINKYENENYENIYNPDNHEPYIEIGFAIHLMDWVTDVTPELQVKVPNLVAPGSCVIPVVFVGRVDRAMRSRIDGRLYLFETKTTTTSLSQYTNQIRPNHQLTGYYWAARSLGLDIAGVFWDAIFVSSRKDGVDPDKDFGRTLATRSERDVTEFIWDLTFAAQSFLRLVSSDLPRWHRNAPTACFMFGGCRYRNVCSTNLNEAILSSDFTREPWRPWEGIVGEGDAASGEGN